MTRIRPGRGQSGAAAVEFAIVLPLLLLILFGTVEFSVLMYDRIQIASATRELARYASVFTPSDLESPTQPRRDTADITTYAVGLYDRADDGDSVLDLADLTSTLGNRNFSVAVLSTCPNVCTATDCFAEVGMQFTHDYLLFVPFVRTLLPSTGWTSITLRSRTRMRCE